MQSLIAAVQLDNDNYTFNSFIQILAGHHSHYLGVSFLQQRCPELGGVSGVKIDESSLVGGKSVIHQDLHPVPEVPEPEPEDAAVAVLETLVRRYDSVQEPDNQTGLETLS